jgi:hypothetical protein
MEYSLLELVSAFSSLAALLTAIIVFFTLIEMQRQRESSYKPDLVFKPIDYSFSANFTCPLEYRISSEIDNDEGNKAQYNPSAKIYNIGLGPAKNLCLTFDFDYQKAIRLVKELTENVDGNFGLTISLEDMFLKIVIKDGGCTWVEITNDLRLDEDYLLPVSTVKEPTVLSAPHSYVLLLGFYSIFHAYKNYEEEIPPDLRAFPELKMTAKFNDIGKKTYRKNYGIDSSYRSISYKRNDNGRLDNIDVDFLLEITAN